MNKTPFVTGAASGIGKATAQLFGRKGWRVGCYDIDVDGARQVVESIAAPGGREGLRPIDDRSAENGKAPRRNFLRAGAERALRAFALF